MEPSSHHPAHSTTTNLHMSCACKSITGTLRVPTLALPLAIDVCHCTSCRHQTGEMAALCSAVPTNSHVKFTAENDSLKAYAASKALTRHFCGQCGTKMYMVSHHPVVKGAEGDDVMNNGADVHSNDIYDIHPGALEGSEKYTKLRAHIFVGDTGDGGLATWLPGVPASIEYPEESEEVDPTTLIAPPHLPPTSTSSSSPVSSESKAAELTRGDEGKRTEESLEAHCHCRGVHFYITRPSEKPDELSPRYRHYCLSNLFSPFTRDVLPNPLSFPDTFSTLKLPPKENELGVPWWIRCNGKKYLAGTCVCDSCREYSGSEISAWAFVPISNIFRPGSSTAISDFKTSVDQRSEGFTTLKYIQSSEDVRRYFCERCGATCFWCGDARPLVVDVNVGLLDAGPGQGARVEGWLDWVTRRTSFSEDAKNTDLLHCLETGLKNWGKRRKDGESDEILKEE